jgi:hypothetical protein
MGFIDKGSFNLGQSDDSAVAFRFDKLRRF